MFLLVPHYLSLFGRHSQCTVLPRPRPSILSTESVTEKAVAKVGSTRPKPTGPVGRYLADEAEHWEMCCNDLYQVTYLYPYSLLH